ncbi:MAG: type II toxin-antitoxin system RelE/ParE family toxin [Melioribacteraceae bacterium]|nr:type II toxin-antitoxin system RelE/ParE family toxin [Melioribacteraceae bacterium]MCF8353836.1 type II toxin-antitoxin system RelE/ParE family toxin [Melioribacteraceae bacterium]MCF8393069.1 type II toxin-antitoxin system RelE/ParE family toxin [Melioribacteraceae bacterium]MCF8419188.1 type II toxin-antitoxin system RelE/ParE family toxin [Melioribacteraceae bacterium]
MPEVNFYQSESGKYPVIEFLDSLNGKQAQKITWVFELFEEMSVVPRQYFKKLKNTDDIWEIRIIFSGDIFRILGFFERNNNFILTNGFIKKSQKTPQSEIKLAEERKRNYYERKK